MTLVQQRNSILRNIMVDIDGLYYQVVLRNITECEVISNIKDYIQDTNLVRLPLNGTSIRLTYGIDEGKAYFVLTLHLVIVDQWARSLLFREIAAALSNMNKLTNSPSPPNFGDYARWIDSITSNEMRSKALDHKRTPSTACTAGTNETKMLETDIDLPDRRDYVHLISI